MGIFNKLKDKMIKKEVKGINRNCCFDKIDYQYETALNNYVRETKKDELNDDDIEMIQCYAGNHIGFFLTWIIKNHFEGEIHKDDKEALEAVRNEKLLGVEFLIKYCDGKFWGEDVSDEIFNFVESYYDQYLSEYSEWVVEDLCDLPCEFKGTWEDYHKFEHVLNDAYKEYKK